MSHDINYTHMSMESTEFMKRFDDGVPIYENETKKLENTYSLVHVDGVHSAEMVLQESKFFGERLSVGGFISFDNWDFYDNAEINEYLSTQHIVKVETIKHKNLYQKYGVL